ncbi:MAG: hypothetical protein J2P50_10555 [Hyphomicrobiaceae bacterium]|nr:hypothetical protein [Hyphomicrobiaceae bacterium]
MSEALLESVDAVDLLGADVGVGLRAQLQADADSRESSINSEVVRRLEHSFDRSNLLGDVMSLAFGNHLTGLLVAIGTTMRSAVRTAGHDTRDEDDWALDPVSHAAARKSAEELLRRWKPAGLRPLGPEEAREAEKIGVGTAETCMKFLKVLRNPKTASVLDEMFKQATASKHGKERQQ